MGDGNKSVKETQRRCSESERLNQRKRERKRKRKKREKVNVIARCVCA